MGDRKFVEVQPAGDTPHAFGAGWRWVWRQEKGKNLLRHRPLLKATLPYAGLLTAEALPLAEEVKPKVVTDCPLACGLQLQGPISLQQHQEFSGGTFMIWRVRGKGKRQTRVLKGIERIVSCSQLQDFSMSFTHGCLEVPQLQDALTRPWVPPKSQVLSSYLLLLCCHLFWCIPEWSPNSQLPVGEPKNLSDSATFWKISFLTASLLNCNSQSKHILKCLLFKC